MIAGGKPYAKNHATSIIDHSKVTSVTRYGEEGSEASGRPKGTVMTVALQLDGKDLMTPIRKIPQG